ncbi:MAG TPA: hypothetical protein VFB19_08920, partial [Mycobacterium sp.]|nr:hypothetical protein [Mycobacterium sp.]
MSELHEPIRVARLAAAAACAALCAVACGSHDSDNKPGANASAPAKFVASAPIDACAMVSADDITALLGTSAPGQSTS